MTAHRWVRVPGAHQLGLPVQFKAAAMFGKLVAMGLLELEDCLPPLLEAAQRAGYRKSLSGLQTLFAWTINDSASVWGITRDKAEQAIRWRVKPLFAEWAAPDVIQAAAFHECAAWDDALLSYEVMALLRDEAERALTRRNRRHA